MIKKLIPIPIIALFIGFILGRLSANKKSKVVEKNETQSVTAQKEQVVTQANVKKDSTQAQQTIIVAKTYSPTGKLATSTFTEVKYVDRTSINKQTAKTDNIQIQTVTQAKSETITDYQSNWLVGTSLPIQDIIHYQDFKPQDLNLNVDYRLFGSVYLTASTNYKFNNFQLGFLVSF